MYIHVFICYIVLCKVSKAMFTPDVPSLSSNTQLIKLRYLIGTRYRPIPQSSGIAIGTDKGKSGA